MGKYSGSPFGTIKGKVGNVVGTVWNGIKVVKTLAEDVTQPNTTAQLDQKQKFSLIQALVSGILAIVHVGFKFFTNKTSPYSACIGANLPGAISGASPDFGIDYEKLVVAQGSLYGQDDASVTNWTANAMLAAWSSVAGQSNALATDKVRALVVCETSDIATKVKAIIVETTRDDEELSWIVPHTFEGETANVYLFFESADGQLISDSLHIGRSEILAP